MKILELMFLLLIINHKEKDLQKYINSPKKRVFGLLHSRYKVKMLSSLTPVPDMEIFIERVPVYQ